MKGENRDSRTLDWGGRREKRDEMIHLPTRTFEQGVSRNEIHT